MLLRFIIPTLAFLLLVTTPSELRAKNPDSPWQPFVAAVWAASSPEEYHSAQNLFDKISKAGNKLPHDDLKFIWGLNRLASFNHTQGDFKAEEVFRVRSFRLQEKKLGKKNPLLAEPLKQLATIWQKRRQYTRAKQALERALKLIEDRYGVRHLMTIDILEKLITIHQITGFPNEAMVLKRRITEQLLESLPTDSPTKAVLLVEEAEMLQLEGQKSKAIALQKTALDLYMKTKGPFHLARIKLLLSLAQASSEEAKYEEAIEQLKGALAISENIMGVDHPDLFQILLKMAENHQLSGKPAVGRAFLNRSLALVEKKHSTDHSEIAAVVYALAENLRLDKQPGPAIPLYNRAIALLQTSNSKPSLSSVLLAKIFLGLAHSLHNMENIIAAESASRQAVEVWINKNGPKTDWGTETLKFHRNLVLEITRKMQPDFIFPKKKREQIRLLQERLTNIGIDPGTIDGYSGPKTRKAVAIFNTRMGLIPSVKGKKISIAETLAHLPPGN